MQSFEEYLHDIWKDDPYYQALDEAEKKAFLENYQHSNAGTGDTIRYLAKVIWREVTGWIGR